MAPPPGGNAAVCTGFFDGAAIFLSIFAVLGTDGGTAFGGVSAGDGVIDGGAGGFTGRTRTLGMVRLAVFFATGSTGLAAVLGLAYFRAAGDFVADLVFGGFKRRIRVFDLRCFDLNGFKPDGGFRTILPLGPLEARDFGNLASRPWSFGMRG